MRRLFNKAFTWSWILCSLTLGFKEIYAAIPDKIFMKSEDTAVSEVLNYGPFITISDSIEVSSNGTYSVKCNFMDIIPIKQIQIHEAQEKPVAVGGNNIGIYIEYDGLMVIDTESIETADGSFETPAEGILKKGDYIKTVDGQLLESKDALIKYMESNTGEPVSLCIQRGDDEMDISILPVCAKDGTYKLGVWIRDDAQGIGTLTYIEEDGSFGALGHGVSDMDAGELLEIKEGSLYTADVLSVRKGEVGNPGELSGVIIYNDKEHYGTITENTTKGIFGKIDETQMEELTLEWCNIGYKEEVMLGKAQVRCSTGGEIKNYEIEIEELVINPGEVNKNFIFQVTDPELLEKTGGIVQGLSGSPIIQNGKLIGAVTHVLVNDPTRGYGIFIENMLDAAS